MTERLLALVVVAASGAYLLSAWPLPAGTSARPGAGFFPLAVGAFGALMALVWTVSAFRRRAPASAAADQRVPVEGFGRVVATAGSLVCVLGAELDSMVARGTRRVELAYRQSLDRRHLVDRVERVAVDRAEHRQVGAHAEVLLVIRRQHYHAYPGVVAQLAKG